MSSVIRSAVLFAKVVTPDLPNAVKVWVSRYVMDERLTMYFKEKEVLYAEDPKELGKPGDYVIIRALENPKSDKITYRVEQLVYKFGNVIDPMTGKRCAGSESLEEIIRTREFFGTLPKYLKEENDSSTDH